MVRLTPKAAKDAIDGCIEDPATIGAVNQNAILLARVRAVPEKGKANAALEKLVAKWLGLPKSALKVSAGSKSRIKTLELDGDHNDLATRLTARIKAMD